MEGFALATEFIGSVFACMGGIALLAFVASVILLGYTAEEEKSGMRVFLAESPFTDVGVSEASEEGIPYLKAA